MVTDNHYRWDFIQLSTDTKPTPATSPKVVNGSTLYTSDDSKLYVWYKDQWYEKTATGGGGGGGSYTAGDGIDITNDTISVDTTTIQEKLTAGSNITISDNTISATDTTYSNFTGTDGTSAGASGLVPAPATTDAGKFLKADGTWDTAGGGGGGDTVYSDKTTSNSSNGGAVYIGSLDSSQTEQADPTSTDEHFKYFWALPANNTIVPFSNTINILGRSGTGAEGCITIGTQTQVPDWSTGCTALGSNAYIYADYSTAVGSASNVTHGSPRSSVFGYGSVSRGSYGTALGYDTIVGSLNEHSVALGSYAETSRSGEVNVGTGNQNYGYNSTKYRVIGGVHDGQLANDAVTVGQVNAVIDAINTALSTNIPHIGASS